MENPCDNIPKNQEISPEAFPGIVSPNCSNIASQQAQNNMDQVTFNNQMLSYIAEKGIPVLYYPYLYDIEKSEKIYGEHRAAKYAKPFDIIAVMEIKDTPSWVDSGLGFNNGDTVTAWVHIDTFYNTVKGIVTDDKDERSAQYKEKYNANAKEIDDVLHLIEPCIKDLIQLKTYGCDRPYGRGNNIYEITNKEDQVLSENFNLAMGHYIWKLTLKRYRYSYEGGMSSLDLPSPDNWYIGEQGEKGNNQVYDSADCVKMFMASNDIIDDRGNNITTENDDEQDITQETGITREKIVYKKKYKKNTEDDSKNEFDLTDNIPGIYDNEFKNSNVITNGYL